MTCYYEMDITYIWSGALCTAYSATLERERERMGEGEAYYYDGGERE